MPTVIDSLIVELGLDPKKFTQGQKDSLAQFKRTQQEAVDGAKKVEEAGKRVENVLSKVQSRVLSLLSLFVGGVGLKQFIEQQTKLGVETGRTAMLFETSTRQISAWRGVAKLTGGSAEGVTTAIGGLVTQFQNFALTGESSVIPYFRALQVDLTDTQGKMRSMDDIMLDLADRFSKLDPARARAFGQALGFDEPTIALLIRGRAAVTALLDEQKKLGHVTKEDEEAAKALTKAWGETEQSATTLGRTLLTKLEPVMTRILNGMTHLFQGRAGNPGSILDRFVHGNIPRNTSGAEPSEVWSGSGAALRTKSGAGSMTTSTTALAHSLQSEIPGIDRFTSFNDPYHQLLGRDSAHKRGQALDFTLKNAAESAAVAAKVRQKLADMGIDAKVIDEYTNPSRGSTGGHIHVQFNSAEAAQKYAEMAGAGRVAGAGGVTSSTSTSSVHVGTVIVNTQATDATGIAKDIKPAIERTGFASSANTGPE